MVYLRVKGTDGPVIPVDQVESIQFAAPSKLSGALDSLGLGFEIVTHDGKPVCLESLDRYMDLLDDPKISQFTG